MFPRYHSKYNSVERCCGILEQHCNRAILDSINTALSWMRSMTCKDVSPFVRLLDKTYAKGQSRVTWLMSNSRAPRRATRRVSGASWPALGVNWSNCLWSSTALPGSNRQLLQFTPKAAPGVGLTGKLFSSGCLSARVVASIDSGNFGARALDAQFPA